jgi:signal transduction histidine kinase
MTDETTQTLAESIQASLTRLSSSPLSSEQLMELGKCAQQLESLFEMANKKDIELQEARQARSKFVSVVTHELRIPMTSIKGYTDLLRAGVVGPVNDQQQSFLNIIRNNVERMSSLVSDLSDINHIETGRIKFDLKPVSLSTCVDDVLLTLKPRLEDKKQRLTLEIPSNLVRLYADQNRVIQILSYLIGNAIKYTPGEGQISICAFQQGDFVRVEIKDTGLGISPEDQAQLFKAFFRSEDAAVRDQPGWGLSLNVAKNLVALMGGQIGAESTLKTGSTFWFTLPIYKTGQ